MWQAKVMPQYHPTDVPRELMTYLWNTWKEQEIVVVLNSLGCRSGGTVRILWQMDIQWFNILRHFLQCFKDRTKGMPTLWRESLSPSDIASRCTDMIDCLLLVLSICNISFVDLPPLSPLTCSHSWPLSTFKAGKNAKFLWNMVKNCFKNVNYFTNSQYFWETKDRNIHLNGTFPLKIANISLQKWKFLGNEITKFHVQKMDYHGYIHPDTCAFSVQGCPTVS